MAKVFMPQKASMSQALPFVGAAVGGIMSGGAGAGVGFSAGQTAAPAAEAAFGSKTPQAAQMTSDDSAISRRMQQIDEDPLSNIRDAKSALSYLPPEQQKEYGPALDEAYKRAMAQQRQSQGVTYG